jgi:hypothetical protein
MATMPEQLAAFANEPTELNLRILFEGGQAFPSSFIVQSVDIVEQEIHRLEQDEIGELAEYIGLSAMARDACYHRIEAYRGSSLLLTRAANGSIIIVGVLAALSYWIVENTIGETIKDAYKESELHERLKAILLRRFSFRRTELARRLNQRFFQPISDPVVTAVVRADDDNPALLELSLRLNRWNRVPPRQGVWAEGQDKAG